MMTMDYIYGVTVLFEIMVTIHSCQSVNDKNQNNKLLWNIVFTQIYISLQYN